MIWCNYLELGLDCPQHYTGKVQLQINSEMDYVLNTEQLKYCKFKHAEYVLFCSVLFVLCSVFFSVPESYIFIQVPILSYYYS